MGFGSYLLLREDVYPLFVDKIPGKAPHEIYAAWKNIAWDIIDSRRQKHDFLA